MALVIKMTTSGKEGALARAAEGDQNAFAQLVLEHQAMVFSIARHFLREQSVAEELAQDVFLQLYQHIGSIRSDAHLTFWLRRTASHRCIDLVRRQNLRPRISLEDVAEIADEAPFPDPMLADFLRSVVAALPETPRMVVVLRYQEELDPSEIATLLEMPISTVKSHLRRSLAVLREKVSRRLGEVNAYDRF